VENASASAATLTVGNSANQGGTFAGVVQDGTGGGALAVVKAGTGTLTLSGTNTYSGGTTLSGGALSITSDAALGNAAGDVTFTGNATLNMNATGFVMNAGRTITINPGVTGTFTSNNDGKTFNGSLEGSGTLFVNSSTSFIFANASAFTGAIRANTANSAGYGLDMYSLSDEPGDGTITLENGSFRWFGSGGTKTFDNRQFFLGSSSGGSIYNRSTDNSALVISTNLGQSGAGARTLTLGGINSAAGTFSGNIGDNGASAVTLSKTDGNVWALGGTNTYSGVTNLVASGTTGRLIFQGAQALSPNTSLVFAQNSSNVQSVSLLDDGVGTIDFTRPISFGGTNTSQNLNIFVGNNNTSNGGSSSGTTTDSTIEVGDITFTSVAGDTGTTTINATGANGYRLQTGIITLNNLVSRAAGQTTVTALNPTTANMTVASVTMAAGNMGSGVDGIPVLRLTGTSSDNVVAGTISNATNPEAVPVSLQKQGTSTWTLDGDNTYTGTTTVSAGTLLINGDSSAATGAVSVTGGTLGGDGIIGGSVTFSGVGASFLSPGNSPGQLTVADLTLGNATTTTMELGGTTLGSLYDNTTIMEDGILFYDGTLNVVNFGAFDMDAGSFTYDLFAFSGTTSPTGSFDTITVNSVGLTNDGFGVWTGSNGPDVGYTFTQSTGDLIISVVPEPGTLALLAGGTIAGCAALRRRRKAS
jgi:autotransporter-associated beta strand protein